ncbi:MAG: hypothetical protein KF767_08915 [Bdellovibrionaceae bacterium]|nr:hypothetical protein [Pseudobdellovibrionaceae bacterium]
MTNYRNKRHPHANPTVSPYIKGTEGVRQVTPTHYPRFKLTKKVCLGCDKKFMSEGKHHRICDICKESELWRSGD